jgi:cytoskeletal protein CcmA (bactofilin family)
VLSGEITTCDQLVVEGRVEAALTDTRVIEIRETGYIKGDAEIDEADIRGCYEGSLTVRNRLMIRSTGKVTGEIRYGMLEIECGGQLSGDIQIIAAPAQPAMASHAGNGVARDADYDADLLSGDESDSQENWQIPARQ